MTRPVSSPASNEAAGKRSMACEVHPGTFDDAVLYAAGANARHGLPLQNAGEKEKAICTVLKHPSAAGWTDGRIAKHVGCSVRFVGEVRSASMSQLIDAPAVPAGLAPEQEQKWKEVKESGGTPRIAERAGKTYVTDVSKIGKSKPKDNFTDAERQGAAVELHRRHSFRVFDQTPQSLTAPPAMFWHDLRQRSRGTSRVRIGKPGRRSRTARVLDSLGGG